MNFAPALPSALASAAFVKHRRLSPQHVLVLKKLQLSDVSFPVHIVEKKATVIRFCASNSVPFCPYVIESRQKGRTPKFEFCRTYEEAEHRLQQWGVPPSKLDRSV